MLPLLSHATCLGVSVSLTDGGLKQEEAGQWRSWTITASYCRCKKWMFWSRGFLTSLKHEVDWVFLFFVFFRQWVFIGTTRQHSSVSDMCQSWHCLPVSLTKWATMRRNTALMFLIHTAFVYMLAVSSRAHHVKRHCCDSLRQTKPRSTAQTTRQNIKN